MTCPCGCVEHVPPLVGVAESAKILGVSKQRINQLAATPAFPRSVARLKAGPVWRRADVEAFHARRRP